MRNCIAALACLLALAGCSGKTSSTPDTTPDTTPPPDPDGEPDGTELEGVTCDDVAERAGALLVSDSDDRMRLQEVVVQVCTEGGWSTEARSCMVQATDQGELEACAKSHLSAEEYQRAGEAIEAAMEGS